MDVAFVKVDVKIWREVIGVRVFLEQKSHQTDIPAKNWTSVETEPMVDAVITVFKYLKCVL
jgi:hypothetical protein